MAASDVSQSPEREEVVLDKPVMVMPEDITSFVPKSGSFSNEPPYAKEEQGHEPKFVFTPETFSPPPEAENMPWQQMSGQATLDYSSQWKPFTASVSHLNQESANYVGNAEHANANDVELLKLLERWLRSPYAASLCDCEGFVSVRDILSVCAEVKALADNSHSKIIYTVQSSPADGAICLHPTGRSLRLRGLLERVRLAAELHVTCEAQDSNISLLDLLKSKSMEDLMGDIQEVTERMHTLKDAISTSQLVEVVGSRVGLQTWFLSQLDPYWWGLKSSAVDCHEIPNKPLQTEKADSNDGKKHATSVVKEAVENLEKKAADSPKEPHTTANFEVSTDIANPSNISTAFVGTMQDESAWWNEMAWWSEAWSMPMSAATMATGLDGQISEQPKAKLEKRKHTEYISQVISGILENPPATLKSSIEPDGSVPIPRIFDVNPAFAKAVYWNPTVPIRALLKASQNRLGVDATRLTVRLLDLDERLCKTSEYILREQGALETTPFEELLANQAIQQIFAESAASSGEGTSANSERLKQAFSTSDVLEIVEDMVAVRPANIILEKTLLDSLTTDARVMAKLKNEGEVPLAFFLEQVPFQNAFKRVRIYGSDARLDALRIAVQSLKHFQLEGSCEGSLSIRHVGQPILTAPDIKTNAKRTGKCIPFDKDTRELRKLIEWYFEPFNLQHNRVLLSVVRANRSQPSNNPRDFLRGAGYRPTFSLEDLCSMPRIARILEQYHTDARPWVLAAAVQTDKELPLRLCRNRSHGLPRGAWAIRQPRLELTYDADFRFIETKGDCLQLQPLLAPEIDPYAPDKPLLGNAFSVVSYAISSDLSHSQSPKCVEVLDQIVAAGLEPAMLSWSVRQPLIKRELLLFGSDFICIQGLQSIGMAERCSEWEDGWFTSDDEPESNHLVHLYRDLCTSNYGVVFAPSLKLPGSNVLCFGNAIFWKRSKWQLQHRWSVPFAAVCAEFTSKFEAAPVVVCSSKVAESYAVDWGDDSLLAELVQPLLPIQAAIEESVRLRNVRPVWCGNFGCDFSVVAQSLRPSETQVEWENACASVLGSNPWTCVSETSKGRSVDFVLHGDGLQAVAALGGHKEYVDIVQWLQAGYPSDHLIQLAVFLSPDDFSKLTEEEWPNLGR